MLRAKALTVVAAILVGVAVATTTALAGSGPPPNQVRAALAKARQSKDLWATVNVCEPRRAPQLVGVRAQMPALGFPAQLSIAISLEYWNVAQQRYVTIDKPNAQASVTLGTVTAGVEQGGETFAFNPRPGAFLRATVTFSWRRKGRLLLTQTRHTTGGHHDADHGVPAHFTSAHCRIR